MTHISTFENSETISERMQEEDHHSLGCAGAEGIANFIFVRL